MEIMIGYKLDPKEEDHLGLYDSPIRKYLSDIRLNAIKREIKGSSLKVLEVGCGHGEVLEAVYNLYNFYDGIDINPKSVELAKARFKNRDNIKITEGDVRTLPYPDNSFDVVICTEVIEHIPDPNDILKEIKRILKPNGIFISTVPFEYLLVFLRLLILPIRLWQKRGIFVDAHLHNFTLKTYRKLLSNFFKVEKLERIEYFIRILAVCVKS